MKRFSDLGEREVLALAITSEEDDARTYLAFANALSAQYPASSRVFIEMAEEEHEHRRRLVDLYQKKFGDFIPLIRRGDVAGFVQHQPAWLMKNFSLDVVRQRAEVMELENYRFYTQSAEKATDKDVKALLLQLAEEEKKHESLAARLGLTHIPADVRVLENEAAHRLFLLQIVQPGLLGLMDGSVSTLAPLFATAFATHDSWTTFLVGTAASVGAGISMGLAEAMSDDGGLTGRGHPIIRGFSAGIMTALGGLGHTLPYLLTNFHAATLLAILIVFFELLLISWIRYKYMDTPFWRATFQVAFGGFIVFLTGVLIGNG